VDAFTPEKRWAEKFTTVRGLAWLDSNWAGLAVGRGGDRIVAFDPQLNPSGEGVKQALAWIEKNVPRNGTLAVLPEGTTINYLCRRVNPTPCLNWSPNMLVALGQSGMTAAFEKNLPTTFVRSSGTLPNLASALLGVRPVTAVN
jgi:hypothetical protein